MSGRRARRSTAILLGLLLLAGAAGSVRATGLGEVRGLILAGERVRARAVLDSLLTRDVGLDTEARATAAYLRATLEEDGDSLRRRLQEFLARDGGHPSDRAAAHLELGRLAFSQGDPAAALEHFERSREGGREEEGSLWLGIAAMALGDASTARSALERASASGSSRLRQRALLALGDLDRLRGQWGAAVRTYRTLREDDRQGPGWWASAAWREAECLENLGDVLEARRVLEELLDRFPGAYEAPLARARLQLWEAPGPLLAAEASPETPPVEDPGAPAAGFAVQVGAFSLGENAERLAEDLRTRGFVRVRVRSEEGLHRVLVGEFPTRPEAESLADSLGAALRSSVSIVTPGRERP